MKRRSAIALTVLGVATIPFWPTVLFIGWHEIERAISRRAAR